MTAHLSASVLALLRPLLLVAAALAMLAGGGVELAPRAAAAPAVSVLGSATTTARVSAPTPARTDASAPVNVVRAGLAPVATPVSAGGALAPAGAPHVAPHLVADPQGRPPTTPDLPAPHGVPDGRAPPLTTGT